MVCERTQRLIGVYRELDRAERRMVNEHLRGCSACQSAWQDELRVRAHMRMDRMLEPSRGFESKLLAIPRHVPAPSPMTTWLRGIGLALTALLGAALLTRMAGLGLPADAPLNGSSLSVDPSAAILLGGPGGLARPQAIARTTPVDLARGVEVAPPAANAGQMGPKAAGRPLVPSGAARPPAGSKNPMATDAANGEASDPPAEADAGADVTPGEDEGEERRSAPPTVEPKLACVSVAVLLFADLAGDSGLDCQGCDGQYTDEDEAEAARRHLGLPSGLQLLLYAGDTPLLEQLVDVDPESARQTVVLSACDVPAGGPIRVQLVGISEGWSLCPASPKLVDVSVDDEGHGSGQFALRADCPVLAPPPVSTDVPTPGAGQPPPTELPTEPGIVIRP